MSEEGRAGEEHPRAIQLTLAKKLQCTTHSQAGKSFASLFLALAYTKSHTRRESEDSRVPFIFAIKKHILRAFSIKGAYISISVEAGAPSLFFHAPNMPNLPLFLSS